jgi:hypothetical protein
MMKKPTIIPAAAIPAQAIQAPTGCWILVGHAPIAALCERKDGAPLTPQDIEAITHCGPGFAKDCRMRAYATKEEALESAKKHTPK